DRTLQDIEQELQDRGCAQEDVDGDLFDADRVMRKFIKYGEHVEIEFDTEKRTATVVVQNEHP
ncbi:MAG: hypothetical protein EBU46_15085, partial [Nitrosomonadaceae bacterium]|nr:hypothetical protein [Nitrosomonadaceae bacterium]